VSTLEIKPGYWRERGGGIARVVERDQPKSVHPWFGVDGFGWTSVWTDEGAWLTHELPHKHDLVEYLGPEEPQATS
jgi:hypothetical protein